MTLLIAPRGSIASLQEQPPLRDAVAFADTDTGLALDAIREHLPSVIAVERTFAASDQGQAFLKRIKSDRKLAGCHIQWVGIRRAPRYRLNDTPAVLVDGEAAVLLDISTTGAHVVSRTTLKPKQRVRLGLPEGAQPVTANVVWAHFELPDDGARYRAGLEFVTTASPVVEAFVRSLLASGSPIAKTT